MHQADASGRRDILICGMFDMPNFGDLMFPVVAAGELGSRGFGLRAISATGTQTGLHDAIPSEPIASLFDPARPCAGILIGGGYIIHTHRMDPLKEYRAGGIGAAVAPSLWLGATLAGALRDVPVAWNAPGVPHPIRPSVQPLATAAFAAADYMSLRDAGSMQMAGLAQDSRARTVPDPILGLAKIWPRADLEPDFKRLCDRLGLVRPDRLLAVHVRRRSLGGADVQAFAEDLANTCRVQDLTPVMIGLGTAHGDDRIARELTDALATHGVTGAALDRPDGLREMAALLAYARAYVGSSLHGYIAACAYGVPGLLVARPAYRKFDGLIGHLARPDDQMPDWKSALDRIPKAAASKGHPLPDHILPQLEQHWNAVAEAFDRGPDPSRQKRLDFAALAFSAGLMQGGPDWAMTPFTTARDRAAAQSGQDIHDTEPF